ncbi:hypothetical protein Hamer_G002639, partial [Homarus americanus]
MRDQWALTKCCCCFDLSTGALFIGLLWMITRCLEISIRFTLLKFDKVNDWQLALCIPMFISVVSCISLVVGVIKERPAWMTPWLVIECFTLLLKIYSMVMAFVDADTLFGLACVADMILCSYFIFAVLSYSIKV